MLSDTKAMAEWEGGEKWKIWVYSWFSCVAAWLVRNSPEAPQGTVTCEGGWLHLRRCGRESRKGKSRSHLAIAAAAMSSPLSADDEDVRDASPLV